MPRRHRGGLVAGIFRGEPSDRQARVLVLLDAGILDAEDVARFGEEVAAARGTGGEDEFGRKGRHANSAAKKGLCRFSSPTEVSGPWPGQITVSSGRVRIFSRLFLQASAKETMPPPIDPAK